MIRTKRLERLTLAGVAVTLALLPAIAGCGSKTVTVPARSASEQLLLTAAADRAIESSTLFPFRGKKVFFNSAAIGTPDKAYVAAQWKAALLRGGALVKDKQEDAELVLEARVGALSIDKSEWLLGLPAMTLPIPLAGNVETPELAIFKIVTHVATAKFAASAVDTKDGSCVFDTGHRYGRSHERNIWFLFFGPFTFTDATDDPQKPFKADTTK